MAGVYGYPAYPSQTEKGVRNISVTMIVFLLVQLLLVGLLIAVVPLIALVVIGGAPTPGLLAAALTLLALVCVLIIVYIIGLIFGLIGLIALEKGRDEFGPAHAQKIGRGIIVLILGIFVPAVIGSIGRSGVTGGGVVGLSPQLTVVSAVAGLVSGALGSLLVGLFLFWSIEALATPALRMRAMLALVLGLVSGVAGGAASIAVLYTFPIPTDPAQSAGFIPFLIPGIVSAAISVVSLVLWYTAYRGILARFRTGELRAAPPVMYPPMYGPTPYPPYPQVPPAGPPAPPPQQPPPGAPPPGA